MTYQHTCKVCGAVYTGETARNAYTRGLEHEDLCRRKRPGSFMNNHQEEDHDGAPADFSLKVTGTYRDPLSRQVAEGVLITRSSGRILNSKAEIWQPPMARVRRETRVNVMS